MNHHRSNLRKELKVLADQAKLLRKDCGFKILQGHDAEEMKDVQRNIAEIQEYLTVDSRVLISDVDATLIADDPMNQSVELAFNKTHLTTQYINITREAAKDLSFKLFHAIKGE